MTEEGAIISVPENRILTGSDLLNFNEKFDSNFNQKSLSRVDLKLSTSNGFKVSNVLTKEECQFYIEESERKGYVTIEKEFPTKYRNNLRYLGKNEKLSETLWERLEPIFRIEDLEGVRPYGFDQKGIWIPIGIDNCFTFGKYLPGSRFKPHYDAVFADNPDRRSIYTIQIYLNDGFKGGNTNFYKSENPLLLHKHELEDSVIPTTGTAIIFNHDTLHEGAEVLEGEKYILRVDMMFLRIDKSLDGISASEQKEMQIARETFFKADSMEKDNKDLESAIDLYVKAQMLLTGYPSIDSVTKKIATLGLSSTSPLNKKPPASLSNIPEVQLFLILSLLAPRDLGRLMCTSKYFSKVVVKDSLWKRLYIRDFSIESFNFEQNSKFVDKVNSTREHLTKGKISNNPKNKNWMITYSNIYRYFIKNEITIADIGSNLVKYGGTKSITNYGAFVQRVGKRQEYQPHYVMSSMDRVTWVVGPNTSEDDSYFAVKGGKFISGEALPKIIEYVITRAIKRVRPSAPIVLVVNPINYAQQDGGNYLTNIRRSLTNEFVLYRNGGLLALQAHGLKSGIVLMMGGSTTILAAFADGKQVDAIRFDISGINVKAELDDYSKTDSSECKNHLYERKQNSYYSTSLRLKDHWHLLVRVSQDYEKESKNTYPKDQFVFSATELYFKPNLRHQNKDGIVDSIITFVESVKKHKKYADHHDEFTKLVITGGISYIPGMINRIKKDLGTKVEENKLNPFHIYASDDPIYDQIRGAKIDLNLTESLHDIYQK